MKRMIPALSLLLLVVVPPAGSRAHLRKLPDFAAYLRDAGLPALYSTELRTLCLEGGDHHACLRYGLLHEREAVRAHRPTLADSMTWEDGRRWHSGLLLKAELLCRFRQYAEALEILEGVVGEFPEEDLLVEAVLMRAECQYRLGRVDDALVGLRSIGPHVPEDLGQDWALYLGLCEEERGNLIEAENLIEEAEGRGDANAVFHLLRLKLKQGDLESFNVIAKEIAGAGGEPPCRELCELAGRMEVVLPEAWHALMGPVLADSGFAAETYPGVTGSVVRLAEDGEDVTAYCRRLLSRPVSFEAAGWLRYALALSEMDTALCDTLAILCRTASETDLKVRTLATFLTHAHTDRCASLVSHLVVDLSGIWQDLTAEEDLEFSRLLTEVGRGGDGLDRLTDHLSRLEAGRNDFALLRIAAALDKAGGREEALGAYNALAESPIPSAHTMEAARASYLLERAGEHEGDLADVVERVAAENIDPVELGDLFAERLHDFQRAASFYRRALKDLPEGTPAEQVEIRLAEALGARALEVDDRDMRDDAMDLIAGLADTSVVDAAEVLRVLEVSTDWLGEEHDRAFDIVRRMGRREDLSSSDLYRMARILFHLFSERDANVYAQCAVTLRRLAEQYPTSREAPLGAFLGARLKFLAGDYVGALESYRACREVWRKHTVTSLCDEGIGDCYLYSGGMEEALSHYGNLTQSSRVAFKTAQCHELLDRPDSALHYYSLGYGQISPPYVSKVLNLRRGLLVLERDGLEEALAALDSPFPSLRSQLRPVRETIAAYALAEGGYGDLVTDLLARVAGEDANLGCDVLLLLSRLERDDDPDRRMMRTGEGKALCKSIFGAMRLLYERAYIACSSGPPDSCIEERRRYHQRFPLDQRSRLRFAVQEALLLYRSGEGEAAGAIVDSLAAGGRRDDILAYGLYREGVYEMVKGDYSRAAAVFRRIETGYPESDLYYDAAFKLGTAYYMLEAYDSSAVFFEKATGAGKPSLVEDAYFNLGLALEAAGSLEKASRAFLNLAVRFPLSERFERALMRAGYTLEQAGRPREAIGPYAKLLLYAEEAETAAEALYWIGESYSEMGKSLRAACEFLRVVHLFPDGGAWTGTSAFRAGLECEKAGLAGHAAIVYRENVARFGTGTDWGQACQERLDELEKADSGSPESGGPPSGDSGGRPRKDGTPGRGGAED